MKKQSLIRATLSDLHALCSPIENLDCSRVLYCTVSPTQEKSHFHPSLALATRVCVREKLKLQLPLPVRGPSTQNLPVTAVCISGSRIVSSLNLHLHLHLYHHARQSSFANPPSKSDFISIFTTATLATVAQHLLSLHLWNAKSDLIAGHLG